MKTMKQRFFVMLAAMLLSIGAFAQSNEPLEGDVNNDGKVDVADIVKVIDIMQNSTPQPTTAYYWYVGQTPPTALPTDDSQLATGLDAGWRKIGNTKPTASTVIFDGTAQDEIIINETTKVTQYFAINSDVTIGSYDSFGVDQTSSFLTGPTISNGMNIFTSVGKSKTFGQIIKVK